MERIRSVSEIAFLLSGIYRNKNIFVGAALFAVLIYRKRGLKDHDSSYCKSADEFEELAVQILNRFNKINAYACAKAIIRQIPAYGNVTWLELAIKADAKEFIAQRAVQDVLNNIWYVQIKTFERKSRRFDVGMATLIIVKLFDRSSFQQS